MSEGVHLVVPFANPAFEFPAARGGPLLPALARWMAGPMMARDDAGPQTLSPPHERVLARAYGWAGEDGRYPFAARAAAADGIDVGAQAWARLTPVHWQVGADDVVMDDPAQLGLDEAESRALHATVAPLLTGEGIRAAWAAPDRWYAAHALFADLRCASLDRAAGRSVAAWLQDRRAPRALQRLQHEIQMVLHAHPVNDAREARGAPRVNALWIDGCGVAQPERDDPDPRAVLDLRLRGPALAGDADGWAAALAALDASIGDDVARLTLCGDRAAASFAPPVRRWLRWPRRAVDPATLLASL